jgi:hypothetical protein
MDKESLTSLRVNAARFQQDFDALAQIGATPGRGMATETHRRAPGGCGILMMGGFMERRATIRLPGLQAGWGAQPPVCPHLDRCPRAPSRQRPRWRRARNPQRPGCPFT